jgi:AcrR family transcriptional regulator
MSQDNLGDETMELFERSLANDTKHYGPDGTTTAASNLNLGTFYHHLANKQQIVRREIEYSYLSKSKYEEAVRIYTKIFGPDNPQTINASSGLFNIIHKLVYAVRHI